MKLTIHGERALCPMFAGNRQCSTECAWCHEVRHQTFSNGEWNLDDRSGWYCAAISFPELESNLMQEEESK